MAAKKQSVLLNAYRDAWQRRLATGVADDDVLLEELRRHGVPNAENEELQRIVLQWWHRGVPPERVPFHALKEVPRMVGKVGAALAAVYKAFK